VIRLETALDRVLEKKTVLNVKDSLEFELKAHARSLANADPNSSFTELLRLSSDTVLLLQDAADGKSPVKKMKIRFIEESGVYDQRLPNYDHISVDKVQKALDSLRSINLSGQSDNPAFKPINMDDVNDYLAQLKKDHSALNSQLDNATDKNILDPEWLKALSNVQLKTAGTVDGLQTAISKAQLEHSKKASHFQSDFYRMVDLQEDNKKKREALIQKMKDLEKKNEKIKQKCKGRLDTLVRELNDPRLLERVAKHNSELELFTSIYKPEVEKVGWLHAGQE
jgi:hypothetical protein